MKIISEQAALVRLISDAACPAWPSSASWTSAALLQEKTMKIDKQDWCMPMYLTTSASLRVCLTTSAPLRVCLTTSAPLRVQACACMCVLLPCMSRPLLSCRSPSPWSLWSMSLLAACLASWTTSKKGRAARSLPGCMPMCPGCAPQPYTGVPQLEGCCAWSG